MAERELTALEALGYLDDIAHGRKMKFDPHVLYNIVKRELEKAEIADIIYNSPFIVDSLAELGKLPPEAKRRYLFGTITNREVQKVEEFFKNGEMRNKSK